MNDKYFSRDNLELVIDGLKVGMTPDWNENDKSEFGYIRNKPFYTDGDIVHQLDEKYIPDSVARTSDLSDLNDIISNDISELKEDVHTVTSTVNTHGRILMTHKSTNTSIVNEYDWVSATYGDEKYVAVVRRKLTDASGEATNIAAYSTDGVLWYKSSLPYAMNWADVAYGNGKYVAIAEDAGYAVTSNAAYSTDGISWTRMNMPVSAHWLHIVYGNDRFVAFGRIDNWNHVICSSTDGINWTSGTAPFYCYNIAYGSDKFVAAGGDNGIAYSADGINWTVVTVPDGHEVTNVMYGKDKFVAISNLNTGKVLFSTDGINWDFVEVPIDTYDIQYCNGNFIVYDRDTINAAYSSDCVNWTFAKLSENMTDVYLHKKVVYANNKLTLLFSKYVSGVYKGFVYQSVNGIDWYNSDQQIVQNGADITDKIKGVVLPISGTPEIGQVLSVQSINDSGKPVTWTTVDIVPTPPTAEVGQTIVVKSVDENGKPTAWECVDAQPDWNQNDETKPDYVKNRPFWTDEITILELGIIDGFEDGTAGSGAAYKYSNLDERLSVSASDILKVSWDGTVYECECMTDEDGLLFFGNPSITDDGEDSGEPFFFVIEDITEIYASSGTSHTVGITTEEAHKLNSKYLPTAAAVADVTATPTADEFNALLAALRDAGYLAT